MSSVREADPPASTPAPRTRRAVPRAAMGIAVVGVLMLLVGGFGGSYQGRLSDVQKNDNAAYLPSSAESTKVGNEQQAFSPVQTLPGFLVYQRAEGLTGADKAAIAADVQAVRGTHGVAADQVPDAQFSTDG